MRAIGGTTYIRKAPLLGNSIRSSLLLLLWPSRLDFACIEAVVG